MIAVFETSLLLVILLALLVYKLRKRRSGNYWEKRNVVHEKPLPLVGNILDVVLLRKSSMQKMAELYFKFDTDVIGVWFFNKPLLMVKSPDLIKHILVKDFQYFQDRNVACNEVADDLSANMLFFLRSSKWKYFRNKTTPLYTSGKMKFIYPEVQNTAKEMVKYIESANENIVEVKEICIKFATDLICSSAFGINSHSFQHKDTPFTILGKTIIGINLENAISSATYFTKSSLVDIFKIKFVNSKMAKFMKDVFLDVMEKRQSINIERRDLIDVLVKLKTENNFKDHELVAQAAQFFLAGYETTSSTISFAIYELCLNKSIQDKLREEIMTNLDSNGDISYETLHQLVYLEKVLSETLRKYPILPFISRESSQEYRLPGTDITIEKGVGIVIPLTGLHYDPRYYPNPKVFDPERFSDENINMRPAYTYLPFGEGQRNCIGARMARIAIKLSLVHILKNFEVEKCESTSVPLQFNPRSFVLYVDGGIYAKFRKL